MGGCSGKNVVFRNIQREHPGPPKPSVGFSGAPRRHVQKSKHSSDRTVRSRSSIHRRGDGAAAPGQPAKDGGADRCE